MISEHVPCHKLLFTLNLTFYVLLTHHKYLYINQHAACMGRNQITAKCFYWMPKVKGKQINIFNKAEHNEGQCLFDDDGSSNDFDDIPSQHTLSETSLSKSIICTQFWLSCMDSRLCQLCWNGTPGTSCMECYRQPQTDALLSAMNCCTKSDTIYFC